MKLAYFLIGLIVAFSMVILPKSYAAEAQSPSLNIHTTVLNPQTNSYVDSLGLTDTMYHPGDTVVFHLTISNNGGKTTSLANVANILPDYVSFVSGAGNFDIKKNTLSFTIANIAPKTTRQYAISAKIADANALPTNQGVVCVADKATLKGTDGATTQSSASFCIQKTTQQTSNQTVYPSDNNLTKTPPTGPETLPIVSLFGSGFIGAFLRKKSFINKFKSKIK